MSLSDRRKRIPEKVVLEKTGRHVEVTSGPYTKRELRELLLSSLSLLSGTSSDREAELIRLSGLDPEDVRRVKDGQIFAADGNEIFDKDHQRKAALKFFDLIAKEGGNKINNVKNDLIDLLRSKGISDDLIDRILKNGLTEEMIRLLRALGFSDDEIEELLGMWKKLMADEDGFEIESKESCFSVPSSSKEYMSVDAFYLMSHFRNPLTKAIADIVCKKPSNPTEYLGHWLLNYKIQEERIQKEKESHAELLAEKERRTIRVNIEPNVSEADYDKYYEKEGEDDDWDFLDYEAD